MTTSRIYPGQAARRARAHLSEQPMRERFATLRRVVVFGQMVAIALVAVQFLNMPFNLGLAEAWNVIALPLTWLYLYWTRQSIRLPYLGAMWLILIASLGAVFGTMHPSDSLVVIIKEIYLYTWFVTVAALLASLNQPTVRRILQVWLIVVLANSVLLIAQFVSPDLLSSMNASLRAYGALDQWRPSALFENANAAAFFQLIGIVPLALLHPSRKVATLLSVIVGLSLVATGSLGAFVALACGLAAAVVALGVVRRQWQILFKATGATVAGALLLGALFAFTASQDRGFQSHLEHLFYGRSERSAEGRFGLWERGLELFTSELPVLGIGPEGFKYVDVGRKQLHNDVVAFVVERGIAGTFGLVLLGGLALRKAMRLVQAQTHAPDAIGPEVAVFLAAVLATFVESLTHQIFHARQVWLMLALMEAIIAHQEAARRAPHPERGAPEKDTTCPALGARGPARAKCT